jgi:SAM-dependent methyltransferase
MINKVLCKEIKIFSSKIKNKKILDYGSGDQRYRKFFINNNSYFSLDVKKSGYKKIKKNQPLIDGHIKKILPIKESAYDIIICTEVLEHVIHLDFLIKEFKRILKKNGSILITTPFVWAEHDIPYDFRRFTSYGIKKLFLENNFKIIKFKKLVTGNDALITVFYSMLNRLLNNLYNKNKFNAIFIKIYFICIKIIIFYFFKLFVPKNCKDNFYIDNFLIVKK